MSYSQFPPDFTTDRVFRPHRLWVILRLAPLAALGGLLLGAAVAARDPRWLAPLLLLIPWLIWRIAHLLTAAVVLRGFTVVARSGGLFRHETGDHVVSARLQFSAGPLGRIVGYEHVTLITANRSITVRCLADVPTLKRQIEQRRALWQTLAAPSLQVTLADLTVGSRRRP